jgi:serine/threonine-protein kinase
VAIHPGDILAGYQVTHLLGRGGMGEVWAAVRPGVDVSGRADVAIKVLLARAALKPDLVRRFEREARIASAVKSPYVCALVEVGADTDGSHLLVFEHLSGESLADRLKREQYLPYSEVGPIIDDVLQGLEAAHEAGVIHRDLKPGNIFLAHEAEASPEGRHERAKILDFGISKLRPEPGQREPTLTDFNATLGSFAYMAPEQVRGAARADERADIYAVGAVAFRSLSGRLPFEGANAAVLVALKLEKSAPSLAEATGEQWPAGIERFLERALAKNPKDRFPTAADALEGWRSIQRSPRASSPGVPPPRAPAPRSSRGPSGLVPAPTKPVITVYNTLTPQTPLPPSRIASVPLPVPGELPGTGTGAAPPEAPAPRPPMPSYQIVEDNPTDVDGPPTMTLDGSVPIPADPPPRTPESKTRRTGRP